MRAWTFPPTALPWLLTSLVLAVVPLAGQLPWWVTVGFIACAFWRQFAERGGNDDGQVLLPSLGWRLVLFGAAATGVFLFGHHRVTPPGDPETLTAFLVALVSLKILELRTPREFTLLALLGYFLLLACFFTGQGLPLTLYVGLVAAVNTAALARCHVVAATVATTPRDDRQRRALSNGAPAWRLGLTLLLQALPLAALGFVLFPRLEGRFLGRRLLFGENGLARTGISDHLSPGDVARLERSDAVAFRAVLNGGETLPNAALYWRALTLTVCEKTGFEWSVAATAPRGRNGDVLPSLTPTAAALTTATTPEAGGRVVTQQITLFGEGGTWLAALDRPSSVPAQAYGRPSTGDLVSRWPVEDTLVYRVDSAVAVNGDGGNNGGARDRDLAAFQIGTYGVLTAVPARLGPRVRALAEGWRAAAVTAGGGAEAVIAAGLRFFRENGFTYTLEPEPYRSAAGRGDALEAFLFAGRRGFCEHYAAAFATLMRAAGLPARVVVGFQGGTWNPLGAHYVVRQADAHAWAEVWVDGHGWRRVDPTGVVAPERLDLGAESYATLGGASGDERLARVRRLHHPPLWLRAWRGTRFAWDTLDQAWNTRVVDYSERDQRQLVRRLGLGGLDWVSGLAVLMAAAIAALGVGALATRWLLERWRQKRGRPGGSGKEGSVLFVEGASAREAARLYARFCRRLRRGARVERAPGEGPLDFADRVAVGNRLSAETTRATAEIARLYATVRYGRPEASGPALTALRAAVRRFRVTPPRATTDQRSPDVGQPETNASSLAARSAQDSSTARARAAAAARA